jgi:predicted nucleic acid-binding protein
MIALDTSSVIAYLSGDSGVDVDVTGWALGSRQAVLPPVVVCELLSDPALSQALREYITSLPTLEVTEGFWRRAGLLRAHVIARRHRAAIADALIAQSCLDHDTELLTRDADFRHFARLAGLRLFSGR